MHACNTHVINQSMGCCGVEKKGLAGRHALCAYPADPCGPHRNLVGLFKATLELCMATLDLDGVTGPVLGRMCRLVWVQPADPCGPLYN